MLSDHFLIVVKPTNSGIPTYLLLRQALGGKLALVLCLAPGGKLRCAVWRTPVPPPPLHCCHTFAPPSPPRARRLRLCTATCSQCRLVGALVSLVVFQCPGCFHEFCMCHILHYYIVFRPCAVQCIL